MCLFEFQIYILTHEKRIIFQKIIQVCFLYYHFIQAEEIIIYRKMLLGFFFFFFNNIYENSNFEQKMMIFIIK